MSIGNGLRALRVGVLVGTAALAAAVPAFALPITFNFDTMGYRSSSSPGANGAVQTYLQGIWSGAGQGGNITVTGAGELSNNRYTGDGHVVGPATCTRTVRDVCTSWNVTPATLGSTDGGVQDSATLESPLPNADHPDNYIVNSGSDRIVITFPEPVYSVSFDFEIFPDGTCPNFLQCGGVHLTHLPDFTFLADDTPVTFMGGSPTVLGTFPATPGTYAHSPNANHVLPEPAPQYLGVSGDILFSGGVTTLAFVDWPQRIGIDNLVVDTQCRGRDCLQQDVPEPGTLPVAGLGIALLALMGLRRRAAKLPG